eukprot:TRINITY_DN3132_c0_g1_i4.p1 TRINITY_DN3132_c0_g1~~TRINITY_DN3132_c0_g1_i4.p1  ORF type:complete len:588 (+),score=90.78 TRINITY_DN3132_c0_g1_i4:95-1858(+)
MLRAVSTNVSKAPSIVRASLKLAYSTTEDDNLGNVVHKIKENPRVFCLIVIDVQNNSGESQLVKDVIEMITIDRLNVTVIGVTKVEHLSGLLTSLSFMNDDRNRERHNFIIDCGLSCTNETNQSTNECLKILASKGFDKSSVVVYSPSLSEDSSRREFRSSWQGDQNLLSIFGSAEEKVYEKQKHDRKCRLMHSFSKATLLIINPSFLDERTEEDFDYSGVKLIKAKDVDAAKAILKQLQNVEHSPFFRILVAVSKKVSVESSLELIRNKMNLTVPVLIFDPASKLSSIVDPLMYGYRRISATNDRAELVRFGKMAPLLWAPSLPHGDAGNTSWKGRLEIVDIKGRGLASKDSNGLSDPYILLFKGKDEKHHIFKAEKILKTLNPDWEELKWNLDDLNAMDQLKFQIWDYDLVGSDDEMGEIAFTVHNILTEIPAGESNVFISKTFPVGKRKGYKGKVSGTLSITFGFTTGAGVGERKHFGKPLTVSVAISTAAGHIHFTDEILNNLIHYGTTCEGIIRIPGNKSRIYQLKDEIDSGKEVLLESEDSFDIAGLLKLYLTELPDSLVPGDVFSKLKSFSTYSQTILSY